MEGSCHGSRRSLLTTHSTPRTPMHAIGMACTWAKWEPDHYRTSPTSRAVSGMNKGCRNGNRKDAPISLSIVTDWNHNAQISAVAESFLPDLGCLLNEELVDRKRMPCVHRGAESEAFEASSIPCGVPGLSWSSDDRRT